MGLARHRYRGSCPPQKTLGGKVSSAKLFTLLMQKPWKGGLPAAVLQHNVWHGPGVVVSSLQKHPSLLPSFLSSLKHSKSSDPRSPGLASIAPLLNLAVAEATHPQAGPILHPWAAIQSCLHY